MTATTTATTSPPATTHRRRPLRNQAMPAERLSWRQVLAFALPVRGWYSGEPPDLAGSEDGLTSELPVGPATTASPVALPWSHCGQEMNHWVQPLPAVPGRGLPRTVTGSPGCSIL